MSTTPLQRAIELAVLAHRDAEGPRGEPYVLHPMRVMLRFDDPESRAAAVLHDTIERGGITIGALRKADVGDAVIRAVVLLTHDQTSTYADYVVRLKKNRLARAVKIADLLDNADLRHVDVRAAKPKKSARRVMRYALSYKYLTGSIGERDYRRLMKDAEG
ncbi:MAG TPA: hypothetical protein VF624_01175 [Tepidisphaeraceae bacterium]|jgi:(p)ppGpp synthase/HD superfamily hydrolase